MIAQLCRLSYQIKCILLEVFDMQMRNGRYYDGENSSSYVFVADKEMIPEVNNAAK